MQDKRPPTKTYDANRALHAVHQHLLRRVQGHAVNWIYKKARVPVGEAWSPRVLALHFFNSVTTNERSLVLSGARVFAGELSEWQRASVRLLQDFEIRASTGCAPGGAGRELTIAYHETLVENCAWGLAALALQVMRAAGNWLMGNVRQGTTLEHAITESIAAALQSRWNTGIAPRPSPRTRDGSNHPVPPLIQGTAGEVLT